MQLVFATNNRNKIEEVQALIPSQIELLSLKDIGCFEEIPETQNTIEGNAVQKAKYIKKHYGYDCFADDTGLEVDALNGAPGVHSAYYAGQQRSATDNMNKLLSEIHDKSNRKAQFKTVIALQINDQIHTFTGICKGEITIEIKGDSGFGYDPIFKPHGFDQTFAEMELSLKNKIGHRGKAVLKLVDFLKDIIPNIETIMEEAWIMRRNENYAEAKLLVNKAQKLCKHDDYNSLGRINHILMQIEADNDSYNIALDFCLKSIEYYRMAKNPNKIAHSTRHLADLEYELGNYSDSESNYNTAIEIYKSNPETSKLDLANSLRGFGLVLEKNGKKEEAISVWKETKSLYNDCNLLIGVNEADQILKRLS